MRFDIISVLPEIFRGFLEFGVCGRALASGTAQAAFWNPRDYASDARRTVDDRPFGGGSGMVLMAEPLMAAVEDAKKQNSGEVIFLAPRGEPLSDSLARDLARADGMVLVCGRYRGMDERAVARADRCVSAGDYVLSGGEIAAMAVMEAVMRHCEGVLGNAESADEESFAAGSLLDAPCYTRPAVWRGEEAPAALLSGAHAEVAAWRREAAERLTRRCRPDLLKK